MISTATPELGASLPGLHDDLERFAEFGSRTARLMRPFPGGLRETLPIYENEFWTSKQRAANRLHEISYRACFKPQLPRFFIQRLTQPGDIVSDPFMGRGTTLIEAALLGRIPVGADINPLCQKLAAPRLRPPTLEEIRERLASIDFDRDADAPEDLLVFYHPRTLRQIAALRAWMLGRELDDVDAWIQMVALNRLTGHSAGFFSVYSMPPNQAVSVEAQRKINLRLRQEPPFRDVPALILEKSKSLLGALSESMRRALWEISEQSRILVAPAHDMSEIEAGSVALAVTSPPFLDVVDYASDNWLRAWFAGVDVRAVDISMERSLEGWSACMGRAFTEIKRTLRPGGWVAFEVGEVRRGRIQLEDYVIPAGLAAGLTPELVLINRQSFTKTANCWGVTNNRLGTNTNRVVLFRNVGS
jgi:hypothetical protein